MTTLQPGFSGMTTLQPGFSGMTTLQPWVSMMALPQDGTRYLNVRVSARCLKIHSTSILCYNKIVLKGTILL